MEIARLNVSHTSTVFIVRIDSNQNENGASLYLWPNHQVNFALLFTGSPDEEGILEKENYIDD